MNEIKNKVIIINGPCGIGKSTVSRQLHENNPLYFLLDIDAQRNFISQRRKHAEESGKLVIKISKNILETCLRTGFDVIVDKMLYDEKILNSFYDIAQKYDAEVVEIILWAPKKIVMDRSNKRGYVNEVGAFTQEKCEYFWDKIDEMKDLRKKAHILNVEGLTSNEVLSNINKYLNNQ